MADINNSKVFEFTYSASQREEIERIRNKYLPKQERKWNSLSNWISKRKKKSR